MIYEKKFLHENEDDVYFEFYSADNSGGVSAHPAILVLPGGGYNCCAPHEGKVVADYFISKGFNCGVLNYSVGAKASMLMPYASRPLLEASECISLMRKNADKWNIDPNKIAVLGFSAGGHLAACTANLWDDEMIDKYLDIEKGSNKPNAAVLCYPVLRSDEYAHRCSFDTLLGEYKDDKTLLEKYDMTLQVGAQTPPSFIWHAYTDDGVPVENTLKYCSEMRKKSTESVEAHIFHSGPHGTGLCTKESGGENYHNTHWKELCCEWLKEVLK